MTQEIIDNNRVIAEFMGWLAGESASYFEHINLPEKFRVYSHVNFITQSNYHRLKFHSDWSWLMPVVEKIESLSWEVAIRSTYCHINRGTVKDFGYTYGKTKIESVYSAVITFINWYNSHKNLDNG